MFTCYETSYYGFNCVLEEEHEETERHEDYLGREFFVEPWTPVIDPAKVTTWHAERAFEQILYGKREGVLTIDDVEVGYYGDDGDPDYVYFYNPKTRPDWDDREVIARFEATRSWDRV